MLPIQTADFESHDVTLMPASDPEFDSCAHAILAGLATPVLALKPYLVLVTNRNPRTIVAYTVSWTVTLRNDSSEVFYTQLKFPDAVAGTGNGLALLQSREIEFGGRRIVSVGFELWQPEYVDSYADFGIRTIRQLGEVKRLRIALDAVIFDDGAMLGPDESMLGEHFIAYVQAKQTLYRDVVTGLETGRLGDDVFAPMRHTLSVPPHAGYKDPLEVYARQSAAEVLDWHDRIVAEVFRRAMRREPFSIRREP